VLDARAVVDSNGPPWQVMLGAIDIDSTVIRLRAGAPALERRIARGIGAPETATVLESGA